MALMVPATIPHDGVSLGEQTVFPALRDSLDDSFTVFHSFKAVSRNREGYLLDTEIDFLIFSPSRGLLVMEVKGGRIAYNGAQGRWYQGEKGIRDPFEQARSNKYKLQSFLKSRTGRNTPFAVGYAVCFPDTFTEPGALPPHADRAILVTGKDLEDPAQAIHTIYQTFKPPERPMGPSEAQAVRLALMPLCEYGESLPDRLARAERRIFALTEEQCRLLDFLRYQRTALVQGCAGSGKTVMAVKKAQELAASGRSVLLLAFNKMIGERLQAAVDGTPGVVAGTYHDYCLNRLRMAGRVPSAEDDNDFYSRAVPQAFLELVSQERETFDALIVDEGQDFRTDYWITLSYLVRDDGYQYIFYDPEQNVFGSEMEFPINSAPFLLSANCRNSQEICEFVARHTTEDIRPVQHMPLGLPVQEFLNTSATGRRRRLAAILDELLVHQGLSDERVVILGGHNMDKTCIPADGGIGRFRIVEGGAPAPGRVSYYTYMKFKGCESDAVILLDVDPADPRWSDRAVYTTASRAKHLLYVIRSGPQ